MGGTARSSAGLATGGGAATKAVSIRSLLMVVFGATGHQVTAFVATSTSSWIPVLPRALGVLHQADSTCAAKRRMPLAWGRTASYSKPSSVLAMMESTEEMEQVEPVAAAAASAAAAKWKHQLIQLAASYDRGFSAPPRVQSQALQCRQELEATFDLSNASQGMNGDDDDGSDGPLLGIWQMIWTTAPDVLVLASSPLTNIGAIYQDLSQPPTGINIIDVIPKVQSLLPPALAEGVYTALRAKVYTKTKTVDEKRVGLVFERVGLEPLQILGQLWDAPSPPPSLPLPRLPESWTGVGFFEVLYLDSDFLIYTQNQPGGWFAFVRVDNVEI